MIGCMDGWWGRWGGECGVDGGWGMGGKRRNKDRGCFSLFGWWDEKEGIREGVVLVYLVLLIGLCGVLKWKSKCC